MNANGTPLGPGPVDYLVVTAEDPVVVDSVAEYDGRDTYGILVDLEPLDYAKLSVVIGLYGRMSKGVKVQLTWMGQGEPL